jgi:hypothetical protein
LAIDPAGAHLLLASTWEEVFRSVDSGQSWEKGTGFEGRSVGLHIEPSGLEAPRRCFAASTEGVGPLAEQRCLFYTRGLHSRLGGDHTADLKTTGEPRI